MSQSDERPTPVPLGTFTTRLPEDLKRRLKIFSVLSDQSSQDVVRIALEEYLDRNDQT